MLNRAIFFVHPQYCPPFSVRAEVVPSTSLMRDKITSATRRCNLRSYWKVRLSYYWVARGILTWSAQVVDLGELSLFWVIGNRSFVLWHVLMGLEGGLECGVPNTLLGWMSGALGNQSFIRALRSSFGRRRGWVFGVFNVVVIVDWYIHEVAAVKSERCSLFQFCEDSSTWFQDPCLLSQMK